MRKKETILFSLASIPSSESLGLSQHVHQESVLTAKLQDLLFSISEDKASEVLSSLVQSIFVKTRSRVHQLVHNLMSVVSYRPKQMTTVAELCLSLYNASSDDNALNLIPELILCQFQNDFYRFSRRNFFFQECLRLGLLKAQQFVKCIGKLASPTFSLNFAFFCWFAPEIEKYDLKLYNELIKECQSSKRSDIAEFLAEIDLFKANDWEMLRSIRRKGINPDKLYTVIRNDDLDQLQKLSASPDFDINHRISSSVFERSPQLNHRPTILHIAAFHASIECFKFLLLNNADYSLTDSDGITLFQFAVLGGNSEIIRLLEQKNCNNAGSVQMATLYYQMTIFQWLVQSRRVDFFEQVGKLGSVLSQSLFSNNIVVFLMCLANGFDPNENIYFGDTALVTAAENGNYEMVKILVSLDGIDLNLKGATNDPPLIIATKSMHYNIVKFLVEDSRTDLNARGMNNETVLHVALKQKNVELVQFLLSQGKRIDLRKKIVF